MGDRLTNLLRHLQHHVELYAAFAVCGFVLYLKIFHHVDDQVTFAAILVTLMLLAGGGIRDRAHEEQLRETLARIASNGKDEGALRWYTHRSEATLDMLNDMDRFPHLVFLGISHRQLGSYLRDRLQQASRPLPWVSLEVYFASPLLGAAYEGSDFHSNLCAARQEIAAIMTDPAYRDRLPHFSTVAFFQHQGFATHTGSMFGRGSQEIMVIYSVHSAVHQGVDTHEGLTMRLSAQPHLTAPDRRFSHYDDIYRAWLRSAKCLGKFSRSLWDASAERWSEYARQSDVLARSAAMVAEMLSPQPDDRILDIGSGSGDSASVILDRHPGVSMVLLDGSPQMIHRLHNRFHDERRVRLALCHLPAEDGSSIDLGSEQFSHIVFHQCLGDLIRSFGNLGNLATWCARMLRPNGRLLISAHNTIVVTPAPGDFGNWKDPFRAGLVKRLKKARYKLQRNAASLIAREQIVAAFASQRFTPDPPRPDEVIAVTLEERRRLWHVPAVINALVHASEVDANVLARIVDEVACALQGQATMPRTDVFLSFRLTTHP